MPTQRPASVANRRDGSRRPSGRGGRATGAGRSPSPAPGQVAPSRRRAFWIAALVALVALNIVLATLVLSGGGDDDDPLASRVAELEAEEEARNAEVVTELTQQATAAHHALLSLMEGMHGVLPAEGAPSATPATATDIAGWRAAVDEATATFGEPPSASTEVNVTRNGLVLAVDLLRSAVTAYESAVATPAGDQQDTLLTLASDLRTQAVGAWAVAATQLDVLNIDAGNGHVHINLPIRPGEETDPHSLDVPSTTEGDVAEGGAHGSHHQ